MRLAGRCALVTGSSSGIGRAIAQAFAREGADVVVHYDREKDEADELVVELIKLGRRATAIQADVGVTAEAQRLVGDAIKALGHLDILVNNAGVEVSGPFVDVTEELYDFVLGVNLKGAFFAAQAAARHMIERGGGRIINITSIHEDVAFLEFATYAASKGGMRMFMRAVCQELAPHGITVNGRLGFRWGLAANLRAVRVSQLASPAGVEDQSARLDRAELARLVGLTRSDRHPR